VGARATYEGVLRNIQDAIAEYLAAVDAICVEAFNEPAEQAAA
jgi:predicted RNase H-like HicB family nuclease